MKPVTTLDWVAFCLLVIGALSWGFFVFDVNILDYLLEMIWDPLDNIIFALIALAGIYWIVRLIVLSSSKTK